MAGKPRLEKEETLRAGSVGLVEVLTEEPTVAVVESRYDEERASCLTAEDSKGTILHPGKNDQMDPPSTAAEETKRWQGGEATY